MSTPVFISISEPTAGRRGTPPPGWALWSLGFRPFYLLAALFGAVSVPLWALQFSGLWATPSLRGAHWHAHEMVFGYALAVVVGFLFTAGRNWSGQPTPTGRPLMALAGCWVIARLLAFTPWIAAGAVANAAVALGAAWGLWRAFRAGPNRRNDFFVYLLLLMGLATLTFHAAHLGWLPVPGPLVLRVALDVLLFMIAVMAGRVVPMFTNNGVPGANARRWPWLERAALGSVLAVLVLDSLRVLLQHSWPHMHDVLAPVWFAVLTLAAGLHLVRWFGWQPWRTWRRPLVWVLHLAYAFMPLHLGLRAAQELGVLPGQPDIHALTVGLLGLMTLGMMTRTSLGHTARPLTAGWVETLAYACMAAAALVRTLGPLAHAPWLPLAALWAGVLWSVALGLFVWRYGPFLCRPRLDGRPG